MTRCAIWRCKQCGAKIEDILDLKLSKEELDVLFETNGKAIFYLGSQNSKILHRCDPETIGLCEFIGWKKTVK